jgi:hypothetical protein
MPAPVVRNADWLENFPSLRIAARFRMHIR